MRIKHIAMIVKDEEETAAFYEKVFGFRRVGKRDGGNILPARVLDLTDEHVVLTLVCPTEDVEKYRAWAYETWGLSHFGIVVDDLRETMRRLREAGVEVPDEPLEYHGERFIKFIDPNGSEIDVADGSWHQWDIN